MRKKSLSRYSQFVLLTIAVLCMSSCSKKGDVSTEVQTPPDAVETSDSTVKTTETVKLQIPMFSAPDEGKPCHSHQECSPGSACIQNMCKSAVNVTCETDSNCPEFSRCFDGRCAACTTRKDCAAGLTCNPYGVCVPENPMISHCESATDCGNGSVCINGLCQAFCSNNSNECACISQNNMLTGICGNSQTTANSSCDDEGCQYYCDNSQQYQIFTNGYCYTAACTEHSQCNESEYCFEGTCKSKECNVDTDCSRGICKEFVCGCDTDSNCPESHSCINGKCKKWDCEKNEDCSSNMICDNRICISCRSDSDCKDNKHCLKDVSYSGRSCGSNGCNYGGKFESDKLVCVECTEDSHCSANKPRCELMERTCVECLGNSDCQKGYKCENRSACVKMTAEELASESKSKNTSSQCASNADCASDEFCTFEQNCAKRAIKCTSDKDCKENVKCNRHGYCTAEPKTIWGFEVPEVCTTNEHCARMGGSKCSTALRSIWDSQKGKYVKGHQCEYLCSSSADCETGESCVLSRCVKDIERHLCNTSQDCPNGMLCNTYYNECYIEQNVLNENPMDAKEAMQLMSKITDYPATGKTPAECIHQSQCSDGKVCLNNHSCGCVSNEQCGAFQRCNSDFKCECYEDGGCQQGFMCAQNKSGFNTKYECICTSDEACGEGKLCQFGGKCVDDEDILELYQHGKDYHYGYNHEIDIEKAIKFYTKAENLGLPLASIQLAIIEYEKNQNSKTIKDKVQKALQDIENLNKTDSSNKPSSHILGMMKSLLQQSPEIYYLKGILMIKGIGVDKDTEKGIALLKEANQKYYALATYELIRQYATGENIPKDMEAAKQILNSRNGYSHSLVSGYAYLQLAKLMIKTPELLEENSKKFINSLSTAAECGNIEAEYQLSTFYGVNDLSSWELDRRRDEIELLSHAAKLGHTKAAQRLELVKQWKEKDAKNYHKSEDELKQEALKGNVPACDQLRQKYQTGKQCAETFSKQGLIVGDYMLMLSREN